MYMSPHPNGKVPHAEQNGDPLLDSKAVVPSHLDEDSRTQNGYAIPATEDDSSPSGSTHMEDVDADRLSLKQKIAYGLGGPPMQMTSNSMAFFLSIFLLETAQLDPYYLSVVQFGGRAWDALTDPIMGYLVTKTNTRFGKLRPWILLSAPFGCLAFFFLFYVPPIDHMGAKFVYYFIMVLALQTGLTAFHVPYSSMTMVLTGNMRERDTLSAFRMAFEVVGVLLGAGLFGVITSLNRIASMECNKTTISNYSEELRQKERDGYMLSSGLIGVLFMLCAVICFFGTREKATIPERRENYLLSVRRILTFKPYVILMLAFLFISLGLQIVQGNLALFITHSLEMPGHMQYGIMVILVTAIAVIPLAQLIVVKYGKKVAFAAGTINMMPILVLVVFIPPKLPLYFFYPIMIWSGFTISVAFLLPWSMLPDVIDDFMIRKGVRKEAAFYSLYVFFNKFAVGFSLGLSAVVLGATGYDSKTSCDQGPRVKLALRYLVGPASLFCFVCSLICLYFYPINEKYRKQMQIELNKLRLEASQPSVPSCSTVASQLDMQGGVGSNLDVARPLTTRTHCNGNSISSQNKQMINEYVYFAPPNQNHNDSTNTHV